MRKPETFEQEGPAGDASWCVDVGHYGPGKSLRADVSITDIGTTGLAYVERAQAQHLRDFARALDRAADALEAAAGSEPRHWCGPHALCGLCGEPWPHSEG